MSNALLSSTETSTRKLSEAGVSIWLDDINRENLQNGKLQHLIDTADVVGVTTNPTIFATTLSKGEAYSDQIKQLKTINSPVDEAVFEITTRDVGDAADLFHDIYESTHGKDGRVSIEVSPGNAYDGAATFAEARKLWDKVGRENVLIKIPATKEGLDAIRNTIAEGISVNVTLIFGLDRYREVIDAYLSGLERADAKGLDLSKINSVASFFVSRVDTEVNKRLDKLEVASAAGLHNQVAVANARLAYQLFTEQFATERARALTSKGANVQRPLWASTGVKTDDLPDTFYVTSLVGPDVVNTMPEKTLDAVIDHGKIAPNTASEYKTAQQVLDQLAELGIDINDVTEALEAEGVQKFVDSWSELAHTVEEQLAA